MRRPLSTVAAPSRRQTPLPVTGAFHQAQEGAKVGSFDWVNTTKVPNAIASRFDSFRAVVAELKQLTTEQRTLRWMRSATSSTRPLPPLSTLSTADLAAFLRDTFAKQAGYDIVVTDTKAGTLHHFAAESHPVLALHSEGYVPTLKAPTKDGQTSRTILFGKGTDSIDIGLRLRITSNNGINAFLGLSKANKSSSVVLKLQQDNVAGLLESVGAASYAV